MDQDFLERLDMARMYANVRFDLNSAVRCEKQNEDEGGLDNSSHLASPKAKAVDIATPNSHTRMRVIYGLVKAGFHRFGIYETFIHVDDDETKPPSVAWLGGQ